MMKGKFYLQDIVGKITIWCLTILMKKRAFVKTHHMLAFLPLLFRASFANCIRTSVGI